MMLSQCLFWLPFLPIQEQELTCSQIFFKTPTYNTVVIGLAISGLPPPLGHTSHHHGQPIANDRFLTMEKYRQPITCDQFLT